MPEFPARVPQIHDEVYPDGTGAAIMSAPTLLPVSTDSTDVLMRRLLRTRGQVAELLGVPESSVSYLHRMRRLKAVRVGKELRWKPESVREFVDSLDSEES